MINNQVEQYINLYIVLLNLNKYIDFCLINKKM
ncbi:Uncharacterised protein [Acinetobacter baumannii]|nr:Uncharacterised protein [Acinetobacter baumannii]